MKRCKILSYLFDYTLTTHFESNKSRFAKKLNLPTSEIYRIKKVLSTGGSSGIAADRLLTLYWQDKISVDEAVRSYGASFFITPDENDQDHIALIDVNESIGVGNWHDHVQEVRHEVSLKHRISAFIHSLATITEQNFCKGRICRKERCEYYISANGKAICPFFLLDQFVNRLKQHYLVEKAGLGAYNE